jgi:hypothetical protein
MWRQKVDAGWREGQREQLSLAPPLGFLDQEQITNFGDTPVNSLYSAQR